jgi:hypothetical protein
MRSNPERTVFASLVGLSVLVLLATFSEALAQPNLDELARESTFIVQATVTRVRAATMSVVPLSENTIVVKVNQVHQAPQSMAQLVGRELTVLVRDPAELTVGDEAVFFAQGWLIGEGVALQEVGRMKGRGDADLEKRVASAQQTAADRDLRARIASAELVVAGKVSAVRLRVMSDEPKGASEHDPQWQEAIVDVAAVLKGNPSVKEAVVLFPGSLDIAWVNVPKFKVGEEGIWILQRDTEVKGLTAPDPLDFQPESQLARIRRLAGG